MKISALLLLLSFCFMYSYAQTKPVQGFVIDKDSKQRMARVYIYNPAINQGLYNNTKGEFVINTKVGDTIFAALGGYGMDTVVYKGQSAIIFQLKSLGIRLNEVKIIGKAPSAQEQYAKKLKDYKYALDRGSSKDLLNIGSGGVGLSIDAIYNLISRDGKNSRRLQEILERDYHEAIIDYRYRPAYVKNVIDIKEDELIDFMVQYRPTYQFVLSASDYAFVDFIKNSFAAYRRNPAAFRLPKLPKASAHPQE